MCCWEDDRETGKKTGEIIEIGIAKIDLKKGEIIQSAQYYVKPEKDEISAFCTQLTGITPAIIKKQGRPLKDVIKSMTTKFGSTNSIYAAWGRDDDVLFKECELKGIQKPFENYINLALLDRIKNRRTQKVSMIDVMIEYGLEFDGKLHSGFDDAVNLAKLALKSM